MIPSRLIEAKRDGRALQPSEIEEFFSGYLRGEVQEHQMAALLMAIFFRGADAGELDAMVEVMIESGETLGPSRAGAPRVDKHSTGGVGDKVSLVLAPLAAELGMVVPMMAGRGLGHTGGTLDKLEAIPGFRTDLDPAGLEEVLGRVGCAIVGQTRRIAPLDKRLYDLRSVTGTVPAIPLIAASIMSKKLAEGLTGLVLDVKAGEGAFVPDEAGALELARTLVGIGAARGVETRALVTAMDRPLGCAVGNALETAEAIRCLDGSGPGDLREVVLALAAEMACVGGVVGSPEAGRALARAALDEGRAKERWLRMVRAQGGDPAVASEPGALDLAPRQRVLEAPADGWVREVRPKALGWGVVELGGGRRRLGDGIDHGVGFLLHATVGERVEAGQPLGTAFARDGAGADAGLRVLGEAYVIGGGTPAPRRPLVSHRVTSEGLEVM